METIIELEEFIAYKFPPLYRDFLIKLENEEHLELENTGICLYGVSNLLERNTTYEVMEYEPDYFLIAQEGDLAFFIKKNNEESIFSNDLGALGSLDMEFESTTIEEFIKQND